jgi:hypothetical protein
MKKIKIRNKRRMILIVSIVVLTTLLSLVLYRTISRVRAAERTWTQTDWRGGVSAQVVTGDVTTFSESSNVDHSNESILTIDKKTDWDLAGWKYRRKILFDNTFDQLGLNPENLTDFPVMIKLENGVNIDYSETNDDGSDIRFVDSDGTELSYEIESWDESGNSFVWVKVPQIDIGNEDYIYMYYSNLTAEDNQNINDVWSNGFAAVWHLGEVGDGTVGEYYDSTGQGSDGTGGEGTSNFIPQQIEGFTGYAQRFDGVDDYINIGDTEPLRIGEDLSINMWLYPVLTNNRQNPYAKAYGGEGTITQEPADYFNFYYGTAGGNTSPYQGFNSSGTVTEGEWNYVSLVRDLSGEMKLSWYINGVRTAYANANFTYAQPSPLPATIGKGYAGRYNGYIDELWISNVARTYAWNKAIYNSMSSDFIQYQEADIMYASDGYLVSNVFDAGYPSDWGNLQYTADSGITIKVRSADSSDMSEASNWSECLDIQDGSNIKTGNCVTDEDRYIQYRVFIDMTGKTTLTNLDVLSISFSASDQTAPSVNATGLYLGNSRDNNDWLNYRPTIIWTEGSDDPEGNGLEGYCISLEEVNSSGDSGLLDPEITSGILNGIDDGINNDGCPYIVSGSSVDLSTIDGLTLTTDKKYYFSIKAVDLAGNVWSGVSEEYQNLVWFRYDSTKPSNVMYISTPSNNFGNISEMFFTWPVSGSSQATDSESGILGWQYAVNSTDAEDWKGSTTHEKLGIEYIPLEGSEGIHYLDILQDEGGVIIGNNTIYFRSIDNSGNVSTYSTGGLSYSGEAPSFPAESVVTITPETSQSNEFALDWPEATPGNEREIASYYYMINVQPPTNINTLKNNSSVYIPLETTSVETDILVGAVKGNNTVYVVAIDDQDNYSPSNMISGDFELDSENPDPPQNFSISDTSVKGKELWRVALTWEEPEYKGNGAISYVIEKSLDGESWYELDTIDGLAYSDVSGTSQNYHYRIGTVDTSDESKNNPSYASALDITPEGRYEEPPEMIDEVLVSNVTSRGAQINWVTDRICDSKVQIGIESNNYFDDEMYRSDPVVNHEIILTNLQPGTTYYYRTKWTDEDGNTGTSPELTLVTNPAPRVEDVNISSVGLNYAILDITTKGAISANILYGQTKNYGGSKVINTSTAESEYSVMLTELEDGTEYHYTIVLTDEEGFEYENFGDMVFTTPPRPQVSNVQIQEKKGVPTPTIEVFWESNIPVNSIVKYSNEGKSLDKVDMELVEGEHVMEIEGLDPDSSYQLTVEGVDAMGNRAVSDVYAFTTATDTRPPEVFGIKSEGDIQSSDIQTDRSRSAQLIISWETDEPSTSQVLYGEGASNDGYPYSTQTDAEMRYKHVMIVSNLAPSKVYHFKVVSKDSAGNVGESGSVTSITPKSTDTVVESVLGSLGRIFDFF